MNHVCHFQDIPYGATGSQHHKKKFDLFLPANEQDKKIVCRDNTGLINVLQGDHPTHRNENLRTSGPIVLYIHGGGWRRNDKQAWTYFNTYEINILTALYYRYLQIYDHIGKAFAKRGIPCAIMSYPLIPLKGPWILLELLVSYVCNYITLGLLATLLLGLILVLQYIWNQSFSTSMNLFGVNSLKFPVFQYGLLTNILVLIIISYNHKFYEISGLKCALIWLTLIFFFIKSSQTNLLLLYLMTLLLGQGTLLIQILTREQVSLPDQIISVEQCLVVLGKIGNETKVYNPHNIYLMGHSSGVHLGALVSLKRLDKEKNSFSTNINIKGLMSISGVLKVESLNTFIVKYLYLRPIFGPDLNTWRKHCPLHIIKNRKPHKSLLPRFLVVVAEFDTHLKQDAREFVKELDDIGVEINVLVIPNTNHMTIMFNFDASSGVQSLADICYDFILNSN